MAKTITLKEMLKNKRVEFEEECGRQSRAVAQADKIEESLLDREEIEMKKIEAESEEVRKNIEILLRLRSECGGDLGDFAERIISVYMGFFANDSKKRMDGVNSKIFEREKLG